MIKKENIKLIDVECIQQYLPDEHPDKISSIPEYVECIKAPEDPTWYGEIGKIYKVKEWNYTFQDCMLEGTTSGSTSKYRFKPSTKEAYDAQNKPEETAFILPAEWCIKVDKNMEPKEVREWRRFDWFKDGYINNKGFWHMSCTETEITLEQFKRHVFKPEEQKVVDMKDIQEECKRRFPIGCKFISTEGDRFSLKDDSVVYTIYGNNIYASASQGLLYSDGEYAKVVFLPDEPTNEFKIGDWVTIIQNTRDKGKTGIIHSVCDNNKNFWDISGMFHPYCNKQIRLATTKEIADYYTLNTGILLSDDTYPTIQEKPLIENAHSINVTLRTKNNNKLKF